MRGREQAARMPAHTLLRGSDTEGFSKGSDAPMTFSSLPGAPSCSNEGFHCNDSQAHTPAYPSSTEGKSVRIDSHSCGASIAWEDKATGHKTVKHGNTESASEAVALRPTRCWGCRFPTSRGSEWPLLRLLQKEVRTRMGVSWLSPFKVPPNPKRLCFFFQCLECLPDAQHPARFPERVRKL